MNQRLKVIVNGKPYLVEMEDLGATPLQVRVNGQVFVVEVAESNHQAPPEEKESYSDTAVPPPGRPTSHLANTITAPMPGHISSVAVTAGDAVKTGQELCKLEAMKMQNAIRSPRDGVIASVNVQPGQAVNHGDVLFGFE